MDQQLIELLTDIKSEIVNLQTELLLMKFAVEKIEKQVEELYDSKDPVQDPFANMPDVHIEKL